jgi:glutamate synthase domain-containing protein 3
VLRAKFEGKPEHVIRFMFYVAEEAREIMASLGFRSIREMVGHSERIQVRKTEHWKASRLDFSDVLTPITPGPGVGVCKLQEQDHGLDKSIDNKLIELCAPALTSKQAVTHTLNVRNVDRTIGAMLAGEVARRFGKDGLPDGTIRLEFKGSAGQSFGAFATHGMELNLEGDVNDYVGKGLSGGVLTVRPPRGVTFRADQNIILGNTALYGATSGKAFLSGKAGERFAVRNSGASAVVEGVGDHGCEYMTGGRVVVLGRTGRNFGAGMSGGFAYVLDEDGTFAERCNKAIVDDLEELSADDAAFVASMIEEHVKRTGSVKAKELLTDWENTVQKLVKVFPAEYRRVLQEQQLKNKGPDRPSMIPAMQAEPKSGVIAGG